MRRIALISLFTLFVTQLLNAQQDSVAFATGDWQRDTLNGLVLHKCRFTEKSLFASDQQIFVLEILNKEGLALQFAHEPYCTRTSEMAKKHRAVAAVNGSFFDIEKQHPICYLRINGTDVGENTPGKDTINRKYYQYGTLCIESDSVFILRTDSSRLWEKSLQFQNIMTAGPLLIWHDTLQKMRSDRTFVTKRHNRTAVGIRHDGSVVLLVADGRFKEAEGLSLVELQKLMKWLGCKDALNMDGGGSSTLYLNINNEDAVINYPSDNGRFDHKGERKVSNAILITK